MKVNERVQGVSFSIPGHSRLHYHTIPALYHHAICFLSATTCLILCSSICSDHPTLPYLAFCFHLSLNGARYNSHHLFLKQYLHSFLTIGPLLLQPLHLTSKSILFLMPSSPTFQDRLQRTFGTQNDRNVRGAHNDAEHASGQSYYSAPITSAE